LRAEPYKISIAVFTISTYFINAGYIEEKFRKRMISGTNNGSKNEIKHKQNIGVEYVKVFIVPNPLLNIY